jgi:hypothetical protein
MRTLIDRLPGEGARMLHSLAIGLRLARERGGILRRRRRRTVVAVLVVSHRYRVVLVVVVVVVSDEEGGVLAFGVVSRLPAAFIVVVAFGDVVDVSPDVDEGVEAIEALPEGVIELPAGEEVSVEAVVVEGVVVVVVVLEPLAALAPDLL